MARKPNLSEKSVQKTSDSTASNQHLRTRRDHANETAEDYVEAIAMIQADRGSCRLTDLSKHFLVSHVTVSKIIARLEREGLVETVPYAPVKLTSTGEILAKASRSRHEIVLAFLLALGVQPETAEVDAEGIEHHVSQETLACMRDFTGKKKAP
ncbi:MAG: manganese-binding transcriptional regulator MntR [Pirellulaceae bacterium]|nr:manganese-binding transcriptional regulator MntR [Pirellulaceae bacterium]